MHPPIAARQPSRNQMDTILNFTAKHKDKLKVTPQYSIGLRECRYQLGEMTEEPHGPDNYTAQNI